MQDLRASDSTSEAGMGPLCCTSLPTALILNFKREGSKFVRCPLPNCQHDRSRKAFLEAPAFSMVVQVRAH